MRYLVPTLTVALHLTSVATTVAQETCEALLSRGVFDEKLFSSRDASQEALYHNFCASDWRTAQSTLKRIEGTSEQTSLNIGLFNWVRADGKGRSSKSSDLNEANFNEWKTKSCATDNQERARSASVYAQTKIANKAILDSFVSCMSNKDGLKCWAQPRGEGSVTAMIHWSSKNGQPQAHVLDST